MTNETAEPTATEPPPAETIGGLWDRERELLAELHNLGDPLSRCASIEAGLAAIARRRAARDEVEAVRAHRKYLQDTQAERAARESEIAYLKQSIADLEEQLPRARAQDERLGPSNRPSPTYVGRVELNLAARRRQLEELEAGGELPVEAARRVWP